MKDRIGKFFAKKENLYLTLALILGLFMTFFNPPFTGVPDEHAHYWKAWSIAEGNAVCGLSDAIPQSAAALPDQIKPVDFPGVKGQRIDGKKIWQALGEKDSNEKTVIGGVNCPATPFGYFPQVIGLKIGQFLHLSVLADFYLARLLNLLVAILIMYWAIRIMPFGKMIFLLIGLLPMTIQQFASLSYDPLTIAFAFLFIAYVLKLAVEKDKKITHKEIAILLALSLIGLNVKSGYFLISFLIFILPFSKFETKRKYWIFTSIIIAANVGAFLIIRKIFADLGGLQAGVDPTAQLQNVLHSPLAFLQTVLNSWGKNYAVYVESFLFKPGWLRESLAPWWYWYMTIGIALFVWQEDEEVLLSLRQRVIFLLIFLANFFLVYLSLYLVWTRVGFDRVSGVQGRYFLAIFPLLLLAVYKIRKNGSRIKFEFFQKHRNSILVGFLTVAYLFAFLQMYSLYYDKTPSAKHIKNSTNQKNN